MKVFYSDKHKLHAPEWYVADGTVRACPDSPLRPERILGALRDAGGYDVVAPNCDAGPAMRAVHAPDYLEYLRSIHGIWTATFKANVPVIPDTFARRANMKRPRDAAAQAGYYCFDMAAPIVAGTWDAVMETTACAVSAAEGILRGERAAYALCRPPGHHAGPAYCGGFCYLNNAAVAAQHLLLGGMQRVAVLDVDYHHGNGTQDIFETRRDVLFASIHAEPDTQYPYFWGHADERGTGDGLGYTFNFPLPRGTGENAWLETLNVAIARVTGFHPQAVVVSLGVDMYEKDTVGDFGLTLPGFGELGRRVAALGVPTVLVQEGGYNLDGVGVCVENVLRAFR